MLDVAGDVLRQGEVVGGFLPPGRRGDCQFKGADRVAVVTCLYQGVATVIEAGGVGNAREELCGLLVLPGVIGRSGFPGRIFEMFEGARPVALVHGQLALLVAG
ncbi:MAG TPA: hypothetical protein DCP75_18340 [Haliea salexigens]|uniref:Uncharacterized protein n=1 Tax=Haliea salexigens TaxID=287487 RepID=A0A3C1KTL2_9GAMM|nr:hypothetical protein [Haliea salexigens]